MFLFHSSLRLFGKAHSPVSTTSIYEPLPLASMKQNHCNDCMVQRNRASCMLHYAIPFFLSSLSNSHVLYLLIFSPPLYVKINPRWYPVTWCCSVCLFVFLFFSRACCSLDLQQISITQKGSLDSVMHWKLVQGLEWEENVQSKGETTLNLKYVFH